MTSKNNGHYNYGRCTHAGLTACANSNLDKNTDCDSGKKALFLL
jgi:hypothetical protein